MPNIVIALINFNTRQLTAECLESIYRFEGDKYQIWVVDNNSTDDSVGYIKKHFPKVHLIENKENVGFAKANNQILREAKGDYYLLLNSDTYLQEDSISQLHDFAESKGFGISSCLLINKDQSPQPNAGFLPTFGRVVYWLFGMDDLLSLLTSFPSYHLSASRIGSFQKVGWVGGTAMFINHKVIEKIGLLDEGIFMYAEDVDYCWRADDAHFKIGLTDKTRIVHLGGGSAKDPRFNQWVGEFKGLLYLYKKRYGWFMQTILKLLIYKAILLRIAVYAILGRSDYSHSYVKVLKSI